MKTFKIFLASSETLNVFRKEIDNKIQELNKVWNDKGFKIELVIWEKLTETMQLTRSQDAYNREIGKCDMFVLLASGKIGKFSKEEFNVAYEHFRNKAKPRILILFDKKAEDDESMIRFKKENQNHFFSSYKNFEELWQKLEKEINILLNLIAQNSEKNNSQNNFSKYISRNQPIKPSIFLGRYGVLAKIFKALFEDHKSPVMLTGAGGLGKTTVASTYYHEFVNYYSHLLWVFADNGIENAILSLAPLLGLNFNDQKTPNEKNIQQIGFKDKEEIIREHIFMVLNAINKLSKPVLFVIDNVDDWDNLERYFSFLQTSPKIHFILTSRLSQFKEFYQIQIDRLEPKEAKKVFKTLYKQIPAKDEPLLEQILKAIGYNTLVITLLAKNLAETDIFGYDIRQLLSDLQQQNILRLSESVEVTHQYHRLHQNSLNSATPEKVIEAMYNIATLNKQSFTEKLSRQIPDLTEKDLEQAFNDMLKTLTLFSVLPEIIIPLPDLERFLPEIKYLRQILIYLIRNAWIDRDEQQKGFKINTIVAGIIRQKRQDRLYATAERMIEKLIDDLEYELVTEKVYDCDRAQKSAVYAESIVTYVNDNKYIIGILLDRLGNFFDKKDFFKAELYYKKLNELSTILYKQDTKDKRYSNLYLISFERLGRVSFRFFKENIQFKTYLKLKNEIPFKNFKNVFFKNKLFVSHKREGDVYYYQNEFEKAKKHYEIHLQLLKKINKNKIHILKCLINTYENIGHIYFLEEKIHTALKSFKLSNVFAKQLFNNHNYKSGSLLYSYKTLGETYEKLKKIDEAFQCYKLYNEFAKKFYNENEYFEDNLVDSYYKLGDIFYKLEKYNEAINYYRLYGKLKRDNNFYPYSKIANAYKKQNKYKEALKCYEKALARSKKKIMVKEFQELFPEAQNINSVNKLNYETMSSLYEDIAEIYKDLGNYDKSLKNYSLAIEILKDILKLSPDDVVIKAVLLLVYIKVVEIYEITGNKNKYVLYLNKTNRLLDELYNKN